MLNPASALTSWETKDEFIAYKINEGGPANVIVKVQAPGCFSPPDRELVVGQQSDSWFPQLETQCICHLTKMNVLVMQ